MELFGKDMTVAHLGVEVLLDKQAKISGKNVYSLEIYRFPLQFVAFVVKFGVEIKWKGVDVSQPFMC